MQTTHKNSFNNNYVFRLVLKLKLFTKMITLIVNPLISTEAYKNGQNKIKTKNLLKNLNQFLLINQ